MVEDNEDIRRLIRSIVGSLAETVYECDCGAKALSAYQKHEPDVVLMDIGLGETDGITATAQIVDAFPNTHVIVVTNHNDDNYRTAAFDAGAAEYVLKDDLLQIRRLITKLGE